MPKNDKSKKKNASPLVEDVEAAEAFGMDEPAAVEAVAAPLTPVPSVYRVDAHLLPPEQWGTEGDERKIVLVEASSVEGALLAAQADLTFVPSACVVHGPTGSTLVA